MSLPGAARARRRRRRVVGAALAAALASVALGGCDPSSPQAQEGPVTTTLSLPTEAWWGGPEYYAKFPQAAERGWSDPSFFPIAVFLGKPEQATQLKSVGVNTYMAVERDGTPISAVTDQGLSVIAQDEWIKEVGDDPGVVGWFVSDECEMGYAGCTPDWNNDNGEAGRLAEQKKRAKQFSTLDDGRFLQANFGNGVLGTWWAPNTMKDHVALMDVTSVDKYAYTSTAVDRLIKESPAWPKGKNPVSASTYGWLEDRMEGFADPAASKPNWVFVETSRPLLDESDMGKRITPERIHGAAWSALIHGAAGVAYFQNNNDGQCGMYSLLQCGDALRTSVTELNAEIRSLAPVLNSVSYTWDFGPDVDTALKAYDGSAYILAMTSGGKGERTFTLPPDVHGDSVEVVGENRTIPVKDGAFTDDFTEESVHHVYKVAVAAG